MSAAAPPTLQALAAAPADMTPAGALQAAPAPACENCAAPVSGRFCSACGQRLEAPVHSLRHFVHSATEDLTHADSRLWRTLVALLFRPGKLTHEFLNGRRARYLPPVRLYLALSLVFFLIAAATPQEFTVIHIGRDAGRTAPPVPHAGTAQLKPESAETPAQRADRVCTDYHGPWPQLLGPRVLKACRKIVGDDAHSVQGAFLHNVPRAMFVFLPLLAASMMLMYWRPRHYYVEHLLLLVHNHAFMFLLLMLGWGVVALFPALAHTVSDVTFLYIVWYTFRSMRVVYGQGRLLTSAKLLLLAFFYFAFGAVMLTITSLYSALTL
ncbi:MAG TPA: DUF3667 domain-containing protein [Steroidobacteraceae bacterium]|jgi:hypothetical protein|nr:DUF3667 domain-containing protein [Steroidobacteraceae bacterium]